MFLAVTGHFPSKVLNFLRAFDVINPRYVFLDEDLRLLLVEPEIPSFQKQCQHLDDHRQLILIVGYH